MHISSLKMQVARDTLAGACGRSGIPSMSPRRLKGLHMASSLPSISRSSTVCCRSSTAWRWSVAARATGRKLPVLILSALGEVDDRITGLRAGGDDYLTKPYHMPELMARIDALARRGDSGNAETTAKLKSPIWNSTG